MKNKILTFFQAVVQKAGLVERRCIACGAIVTARPDSMSGSFAADKSSISVAPPQEDTPYAMLCPSCREKYPQRTTGYCPDCGHITLPATEQPTRCAACRQSPPLWDKLYFYGLYEKELRESILRFKFQGAIQEKRLLSWLLLQTLPKNYAADLIIPVPLHPRRLQKRGFNQSLELARGIKKRCCIPIDKKSLSRTRYTVAQMKLDRQNRQTNIQGAFSCAKLPEGCHILLIDDVLTTGATLRECTKSLLKSGAKKVDILAIARA